ncbi:hypothetical protein MYA_0834 [Burkholderia sp. KJ006]|nr:hypothetical protein MYA_0834 [Burkholderia sp. KJ006]
MTTASRRRGHTWSSSSALVLAVASRCKNVCRERGASREDGYDPQTEWAACPSERSASCLEFVIVHYGTLRAVGAWSGKNDRVVCPAWAGRTKSCVSVRHAMAARAGHRGGPRGPELQFATNARPARSGFSLHCLHATCAPAVADRSAQITAPAGESK